MKYRALLLAALLLAALLCLVSFGAGPGFAGEGPTPAARADAFVKAWAAKDQAALAKLAAADFPDPWRVVESLLIRGHPVEAAAFSATASAEGTQGLAAYGKANAKGIAKSGQGPVTKLGGILERARELRAQRKPGEAAALLDRAATEAAALGWLTFASETHYQAGLVFHGVGKYAAARIRFERNRAIELRIGSKVGDARGQFRLATASLLLGETKDAVRMFALARRASEAAGDTFYVAKGDMELGRQNIRARKVRAGIVEFERALLAWETLDEVRLPHRFRASPLSLASVRQEALLNLASMHAKLDEQDKARSYARQAVRESRKAGDDALLLAARAFLAALEGAIAQAQGHLVGAVGHFSRANELYARLGRPTMQADSLRRLAAMRLKLSDLPNALKNIKAAIVLLGSTDAKPEILQACNTAVSICSALGRYEEAARHAERAKALALVLEDAQLRIDVLLVRSGLALRERGHDEALRLLHRAQEIHRAHEATDIKLVELQIARWLYGIRDFEGALALVHRLQGRLEAYGNHTILLDLRRLAGACHWQLGQLDRALAEYSAVLAAHAAAGDQMAQIGVLDEMVALCIVARRFREGVKLAQRGIGLATQSGDRASEVRIRLQFGRALLWNKEPERALEEILFAAELATELNDIPLRARALGTLAEAHYYRSEPVDAMRCARDGVELGLAYGLEMSEGSRANARARFAYCARWGLAAAVDSGSIPYTYYFLELMRARSVVVSLGGRDRLRNAHVPRALRLAQDDAKAAAAMAYERWITAMRRGARPARLAARSVYDKALAKERDIMRSIQHAVRSDARLQDTDVGRAITWPEAAALCTPSDALVLYGHDGMDYVAMVITGERTYIARLGRCKTVHAAVDTLLADPKKMPSMKDLRALLYTPLKLPATVTRVIVSPAGSLAYVPFAGLDPKREFCSVPSATSWAALRKAKVEAGTRVLALADPAYGLHRHVGPRVAGLDRGRIFAPLPATRIEAKGIRSDMMLLGPDATETRLREILASKQRWRSIHLACHGVVDDLIPTQSALVLGRDRHNDGFLHADEIHDQIHIATELVVLSACETGRGRVYGGEGLLGLSRAFMLAGAPRVLCSLWKVDDEATSELMVKFYELWNPPAKAEAKPVKGQEPSRESSKAAAGPKPRRGMSPTKALRLAQEHIRSQEKWADPYYWAAWVLWGLPD